METFYLIDFENVHEEGLCGANRLSAQDHVHLFSTKNMPQIKLDVLSGFNGADFNSHILPVGNQSLDMHLVTFLGFLIGQNRQKNDAFSYVIISRDRDYDRIISYWKQNEVPHISRRERIFASAGKENAPALRRTSPAAEKFAADKTALNAAVQKAVSQAGYESGIGNKAASIVSRFYGHEQFIENVRETFSKEFEDAPALFSLVKPILDKNIVIADTGTRSPAVTTQLNNEVQRTLSRAKYSKDIINFAASTVSHHYADKNGKQTIYRMIVAKHGQKNGLNIYRHIKNLL